MTKTHEGTNAEGANVSVVGVTLSSFHWNLLFQTICVIFLLYFHMWL